MATTDDQQFCLRWNNFQANITSQFETLRDDEDFTDVTIACEGQRIQAHKVVLSACSPFFKELFKSNPCTHPIIFMRDVEACHVVSLMEFMYAGQVNVAQAHLSTFLKTAESLKIRGLTDTSENILNQETDTLYLNRQSKKAALAVEKSQISSTNNVSSTQDVSDRQNVSSPPPKKSKSKTDIGNQEKDDGNILGINEDIEKNAFPNHLWQPKDELPDYFSECDEEDREENKILDTYPRAAELEDLPGNIQAFSKPTFYRSKEIKQESLFQGFRRTSNLYASNISNNSSGFINETTEASSFLGLKFNEDRTRLIKLADGIEVYEDQLRGVKWSDYRKLTRGLATILFSPAELATCSVTGQRWSRAGSGERPVKPALDRAKVQAIISYVATRFPTVEISRIKQVLAYKCKENSTALKMKAVRYYK